MAGPPGTCPEGTCTLWHFSRRNLSGSGTCLTWQLSGGNVSTLVLFQGETCPPGTCSGGETCLLALNPKKLRYLNRYQDNLSSVGTLTLTSHYHTIKISHFHTLIFWHFTIFVLSQSATFTLSHSHNLTLSHFHSLTHTLTLTHSYTFTL